MHDRRSGSTELAGRLGHDPPALGRLIDRFSEADVLVVGDAILDSYLRGSPTTLSREAPVPIVQLEHREDLPGGAANVAANAAALGARVRLLSVVGEDAEGERLLALLRQRDVVTDAVVNDPARQTLAKHRVVGGGQILVRFDQGTTTDLEAGAERSAVRRLTAQMASADVVIVSDYEGGVLTPRVVRAIERLQARRPRPLVADAKDLRRYREAGVSAVTPNWAEALSLLAPVSAGDGLDRAAFVDRHGERLLRSTGAGMAVVTLDEDGAVLVEPGRPSHRTWPRRPPRPHSPGAGDTFAAAFALALAAGADGPTAAELATAAAAIVVGKPGTDACSEAELRERVVPAGKVAQDPDRLVAQLAEERRRGGRIVLTSGCFDILHRGHVAYLSRAKALGEVLVVAVNSDASARRLKGGGRPINTLEDRLDVLAGLSCVDRIVAFDAARPTSLIRAVRPDVFAKGGDYTRDTVPERALVERLGGRVEILPFVADLSTTGIIHRIRSGEHAPPPPPPAAGAVSRGGR
jgi:D-beta-D-heptose 7-phosphate kinase / D-beta-D-heptose 1-phosphate adenosyltransferase